VKIQTPLTEVVFLDDFLKKIPIQPFHNLLPVFFVDHGMSSTLPHQEFFI
jgi:hypothetical protein